MKHEEKQFWDWYNASPFNRKEGHPDAIRSECAYLKIAFNAGMKARDEKIVSEFNKIRDEVSGIPQ